MNALRVGNFTSSEIAALMSNDRTGKKPGAPYINYINECNIERRLCRSISEEVTARALSWGKTVERYVFNILGTEYSLVSNETLPHPTIDCWYGSPDNIKYVANIAETVCDIKCPLTLKSFCQLVDAWSSDGIEGIRNEHKDGEKFYWQLVSNACITGCEFAELIVFAPYRNELDDIRSMVNNPSMPDIETHNAKWIAFALDDELPWLIKGGHYNNINIMRFKVPESDKQALTDRVIMAKNELVEYKIIEPNV